MRVKGLALITVITLTIPVASIAFCLNNGNVKIVTGKDAPVKTAMDSFVLLSLPTMEARWGKENDKAVSFEDSVLLFPDKFDRIDIGNMILVSLANGRKGSDVTRVEVRESPSIERKGRVLYTVNGFSLFDREGKKIPFHKKLTSVYICAIDNRVNKPFAEIICESNGFVDSRLLRRQLIVRIGDGSADLGACETKGMTLIKDFGVPGKLKVCGRVSYEPAQQECEEVSQ